MFLSFVPIDLDWLIAHPLIIGLVIAGLTILLLPLLFGSILGWFQPSYERFERRGVVHEIECSQVITGIRTLTDCGWMVLDRPVHRYTFLVQVGEGLEHLHMDVVDGESLPDRFPTVGNTVSVIYLRDKRGQLSCHGFNLAPANS